MTVTSVNGSTTYQRPFGPNAPWNVPVDRLQIDPNSAYLSNLLWNESPDRPGNFNMNFVDYTYPVYDASQATGWYTVRTTWNTNINGTKIPWNPAWKAAPGTDAQVIVLDPATGREWDLWQVSFDGSTIRATNGSLVPSNYATYEGGNSPSRGVGIQYLAMLVRPEEIAQGRIEHALSMPISNPDGTRYVAPATKLEHATGKAGIPEGTRFALNISDQDIANWLNSLPAGLSPETLRSARIIAEALRDYGWFITDTAGGATLQFEANSTAASDWAQLGLTPQTAGSPDFPRDLLDGLMRPEKIYAIRPSNQYTSSAHATKSSTDATLGSADFHLALEGTSNVSGTGNAGNNDIRGNAGSNVLKGLAGNDWLAGGLGNDTLVGGTGNDTLDGSVGNDVFVMAKGDGTDVIRDFEPGTGGGDVVQLDGFGFTSFDQVKAAMRQSGAHVVLSLGGTDSLTFQYRQVAEFTAGDFRFGTTTPTPTPPPTPTPEPGTGVTLNGTAGADYLVGTAGNDRIDGGEGNDIIDGRAGNDWLRGGGGSDVIVFAKGYGADQLNWFSTGFDKLDLRSFGFASFQDFSQKVAVSSGVDGTGVSYARLDFGGGDTLQLSGVTAVTAGDLMLANGGPAPTPTPQPAPTQPALFTLPVSGVSTKFINGTEGNDTLTGTTANDMIGGRGGADRMSGGWGDDVYYVGQETDTVVEYSGQGIDTVYALAGRHTLAANVENLTLDGSWAHTAAGNGLNNQIALSAGGDTVNAAAGDDILIAGAGADRMTGGAGRDIFVLGSGTAPDVITDFVSRTDILDFRGLTKPDYAGVNPFADGVISVAQSSAGAVVSFDKDGSAGAAAATPIVTLTGIMASTLLHQDIVWS